MENNLIFTFGAGIDQAKVNQIRQILIDLDGRGLGWDDIEKNLIDEKVVDSANLANCLVVKNWESANKTANLIRGLVEIKTGNPYIDEKIIASAGCGAGLCFRELRRTIWKLATSEDILERSADAYWLGFHIRYDIDQFIGCIVASAMPAIK